MLARKGRKQFHVSNRFALLAGLILAITALAGIPGSDRMAADAQGPAPAVQSAEVEAEASPPKRKFSLAFLLFRHG